MARLDLLWKSIIEEFFPHFLEYFFNDYLHQIDFEKGFEFLDKELKKIAYRSEDSRRFSDKLVKIYLKSGKNIGVLIHIEVQGYIEENFAERMYINQYRIFDRYKLPTSAIAIFTDDSPNFHPKKYQSNIFHTSILYSFATYKLREKKIPDFNKSTNPFSIILETAWWNLSFNKLTDKELFGKKIALFKRMYQLGYPLKQTNELLDFIKFYSKFESKELYEAFDKEIIKITKDKKIMSIREAVIEGFKLEAKEEGLVEGRVEGRVETIEILKRLRNGEQVKNIAKALNLNVKDVKEIAKFLDL